MTAVEVRGLVQESLSRHQEPTKPIRVVSVDTEPIDGQWQVLVEPTIREPEPRYRYYEMLGEVEDELAQRSVSVFLTPAPEATYSYEVDGVKVEVKRRDQVLFVSTVPWTGYSEIYSLEGSFRSSGVSGKDNDIREATQESPTRRFEQAVQSYLDEKKHYEERDQTVLVSRP